MFCDKLMNIWKSLNVRERAFKVLGDFRGDNKQIQIGREFQRQILRIWKSCAAEFARIAEKKRGEEKISLKS